MFAPYPFFISASGKCLTSVCKPPSPDIRREQRRERDVSKKRVDCRVCVCARAHVFVSLSVSPCIYGHMHIISSNSAQHLLFK